MTRRNRRPTAADTAAVCDKASRAVQQEALCGAPAYDHDPVTDQMRRALAVIRDDAGGEAPDPQRKA